MIIFESRTGNVRNVVGKLGLPSTEVKENLEVNEGYFIFTYTDKIGMVPGLTKKFLEKNHEYLKGVIVSGNINFGEAYCGAANLISNEYGVPIIRKIDLRGNSADVEYIKQKYNEMLGEQQR